MTKRLISEAADQPLVLATALLLAAGRGERMRPLTDATPKPLLTLRDQPLMQWAMQGLQRGGVSDLVINTAWLGEQIAQHFGNTFQTAGQAPMRLHYSQEGVDFGGALETAGGIVRALPQLQDVFWVVAGDVFAPDFVFEPEAFARFKTSPQLAHIWLVPNPEHNLGGDFGLLGRLSGGSGRKLLFGGSCGTKGTPGDSRSRDSSVPKRLIVIVDYANASPICALATEARVGGFGTIRIRFVHDHTGR
jgi:molybdopterin-guanine dinucleotide biosynthesis protein A